LQRGRSINHFFKFDIGLSSILGVFLGDNLQPIFCHLANGQLHQQKKIKAKNVAIHQNYIMKM
jgi:hypothetical protein